MPFVPVNCGAFPADLIENELFGHVRGSFTGAAGTQPGLVSEATEGTLFLDEIDCLPLRSQVKFLRLLQEKEYRPIGASKPRRIDIRIIAATNADLENELASGRFRADLYYRLKIASLSMPPLRDHRCDIPLLARHFVSKYASEHGRDVSGIKKTAMSRLCQYDWPGNVRELENVIERAVIFATDNVIGDENLDLNELPHGPFDTTFREAKARIIEEFEREYVEHALLTHSGNVTRAAASSGKHRRAFWELIRKYDIDVEGIRQASEA
jgi:transcriptional regulator with PAS, ATPase and Fis domain